MKSSGVNWSFCCFTFCVLAWKVLAITCRWALLRLVRILTRVTASERGTQCVSILRIIERGWIPTSGALHQRGYLSSPALFGSPQHPCLGWNWWRAAPFPRFPNTSPAWSKAGLWKKNKILHTNPDGRHRSCHLVIPLNHVECLSIIQQMNKILSLVKYSTETRKVVLQIVLISSQLRRFVFPLKQTNTQGGVISVVDNVKRFVDNRRTQEDRLSMNVASEERDDW